MDCGAITSLVWNGGASTSMEREQRAIPRVDF